jgi:sugar lactone lactonase YvrE
LHFPNCMALDQDESYLYVVRTTPAGVVRLRIRGGRDLDPPQQFGPDLGGRRLDEYGDRVVESLGDPQLLGRWGMADGCAFDAAGNLWVTVVGANRIVAITPDETVVPLVDDPDGQLLVDPTSIAWGGPDMRDVYVGSITAPHILKGRTSVSGLRMVHQRQAV